jgi:hypothetical protein
VRFWSVVISADRYDAERLYRHDGLVLADLDRHGLAIGDRVALVAATRAPVVFALGTVCAIERDQDATGPALDDPESPLPETGEVAVAYQRRMFDHPLPASGLPIERPVTEIDPGTWASVTGAGPAEDSARTWLVSVDLPIEAPTAAEAVRQFWTYVAELGPRELPAFVSPAGDELAMQAMVSGVEVNLDPEEEE